MEKYYPNLKLKKNEPNRNNGSRNKKYSLLRNPRWHK